MTGAVKTWAEQPIQTEYRGTNMASASFVDNDHMEAARQAVLDMVPAKYAASVKVVVLPFDQRTWDYSDIYHTGMAVAMWGAQ